MLMNKFDYLRLMSRKGCSQDNSMCEGFFMKNVFFYSKNLNNVGCDKFNIWLSEYLKWFSF